MKNEEKPVDIDAVLALGCFASIFGVISGFGYGMVESGFKHGIGYACLGFVAVPLVSSLLCWCGLINVRR